MSNTFGHMFRVTTWGESHGPAVGAVIDGCPPRIPLDVGDIQKELEKRRPGRGAFSSSRKELDRVEILSGVFEGKTTGTPISLIVWNKDPDSRAYESIKEIFRPGHADYTYYKKYGIRDWRGGGRASARETVARVAAGAVAQRVLDLIGTKVVAYTIELAGVKAEKRNLEEIESNMFYCPDQNVVKKMTERIAKAKRAGDSVGGIVEILVKNCPVGLGSPVFGKFDAVLAGALMSVGAVKGVEIGSGFQAPRMLGSENNDEITSEGFLTNNAGGVLGGISNGDEVIVRVAVKPIPSIEKEQRTIDIRGNPVSIKITGRHDVTAIPRIVPVCEAMVRLCVVDFFLQRSGNINLVHPDNEYL